MRLGGRMAAAIDILRDIDTRHRPVSQALKDWGTSHRFAGSGDRAAIGNLVYDALRKRASHAAVMGDDTPEALVCATVIRDWGLAPDALVAQLDGDSHAPSLPAVEQLRLAATASLDPQPDHIAGDFPPWLAPSLSRVFRDQTVTQMQAMAARPTLDIRVNTLKATLDKAARALAPHKPERFDLLANALRFPAGEGPSRLPNVAADPAFAKGWFEVQDAGSQLAAMLTCAKSGEQVLDYCAGGGGKALAMAAAMTNGGQIHAYDIERARLSPIIERMKRAGTRNIQLVDGDQRLAQLEGKMDCVLIDAPCTGTGTWRRRPDTKWKLSPENLASRIADQDAVLDAATRYVKLGGRIVYVTCSILPEENADRIAAFLARTSGYQPRKPAQLWQDAGLSGQAWLDAGCGLMLTPHTTGTDGFFVAVIERQA
jgi:16S rRNA (cytosine967-C5)-methyltransferase